MKYIIDVPDEQRHIYDEEDKVLSFLVINKNSKCNIAIDIEAIPYDDSEPEVMKNNYIHLCSSCQYGSSLVPCPGEVKDNIFCGGNSNICCCSEYKPDTADRKDIENKVWDLAREIAYNMTYQECLDAGMLNEDEVYNTATGVLSKLTYQEAKKKYAAWMKQKDEIRVGDEVEYTPNKAKGIVVQCHVPDVYAEVDKYAVFTGTSVEYLPKEWLTKTGRVFPEVEELLKKMREG